MLEEILTEFFSFSFSFYRNYGKIKGTTNDQWKEGEARLDRLVHSHPLFKIVNNFLIKKTNMDRKGSGY